MSAIHKSLCRWQTISLSLSLLLTGIVCSEENQPEIFLSPRNFNPHPYQMEFDPRGEADAATATGPVVFPPSPPGEDDEDTNRVISIKEQNFLQHTIDEHPYSKIVEKQKYKNTGRFNNDQNLNTISKIYKDLNSEATKLLLDSSSDTSNQKKNYKFSYKVVDHLTGDDYSHTESQDSHATNGEYRVKLPDGRIQIVSYIADKNGYKADVKYTENEFLPKEIPDQKANLIPYYDGQQQYNGASISYPDYKPIYPKYVDHYVTPGTVQLYVSDNEIRKGENYLGSTVAPYLLENDKYQHSIASNLGEFQDIYVIPQKNPATNTKSVYLYYKN